MNLHLDDWRQLAREIVRDTRDELDDPEVKRLPRKRRASWLLLGATRWAWLRIRHVWKERYPAGHSSGVYVPTERQIRLGSAALVPFVFRWKLSLNPEDLDEMAYAVLLHAFRKDPDSEAYDAIEAEVNAQIDEFVRLNAFGRPREEEGENR